MTVTGISDGGVPRKTPPRWWSTFGDGARWYGVFQGGGAKGIAYVAPLRQMALNDQWFSAAAGSSAGAITASLVAAGFHPDELSDMTAELLRTVGPDTLADAVLYWVKPLRPLTRYSLNGLECAIEQRLRAAMARHGGDSSRTVTFGSLVDATGIGLYVLALDASLGRPVPFCAERTPGLSVSAAVAASCSIPLVFAPRYVQVAGVGPYADGWPPFRRLVDGGAWANFPAFVYNDAAFREFFGLAAIPDDAKVMGFVFDTKPAAPLPSTPVRFTEDPHDHIDGYGADLMLGDPSRRFSSEEDASDDSAPETTTDKDDGVVDHLRWWAQLARRATPALVGIGAGTALLVALMIIVVNAALAGRWVTAALGGISLLIAGFAAFIGRRLFKALMREGADTFRSLVGLATAPPVWAGVDPKTLIVWVPVSGVDTTDFRLGEDDVERTVQRAESSCRDQIAQALKGETFYRLNRRMLTGMHLPEPDLTSLEQMVPTRIPPSAGRGNPA